MKKVLCIAVHPDDETLGCGGSLLKHKKNGDEIYWLIITNISTKDGWAEQVVNTRQKEIEKVASLYKFDDTIKLDFPTTKLDTIPISDIVTQISKVFNNINPNIVYLPNRSDVHTDHKIAFEAAYSCTKNFRYPFIERILMMEVLSETEFAPSLPEHSFIPNTFIDTTAYMNKKLEIFQVFESEVMKDNLPRSISAVKSLAAYRGSKIGVKYAEAFMLLFEKQ